MKSLVSLSTQLASLPRGWPSFRSYREITRFCGCLIQKCLFSGCDTIQIVEVIDAVRSASVVGRLTGHNLSVLQENAPNITLGIANRLDCTTGELRAQEIPFPLVISAVLID